MSRAGQLSVSGLTVIAVQISRWSERCLRSALRHFSASVSDRPAGSWKFCFEFRLDDSRSRTTDRGCFFGLYSGQRCFVSHDRLFLGAP